MAKTVNRRLMGHLDWLVLFIHNLGESIFQNKIIGEKIFRSWTQHRQYGKRTYFS